MRFAIEARLANAHWSVAETHLFVVSSDDVNSVGILLAGLDLLNFNHIFIRVAGIELNFSCDKFVSDEKHIKLFKVLDILQLIVSHQNKFFFCDLLFHHLKGAEEIATLGFLVVIVEHDFKVVKTEVLVEEVLLVPRKVWSVNLAIDRITENVGRPGSLLGAGKELEVRGSTFTLQKIHLVVESLVLFV